MSYTEFYIIKDNKQKFIDAINILLTLVTTTLGPIGKTVALYNGVNIPHITKDGVTVSEFIKFQDPFQEAINKVIKETARKTGETVGDGTTTSVLLACNLLLQLLNKEDYITELNKLDTELNLVIAEIKNLTKELNEFDSENVIDILKSIASMSSNGDVEITNYIIDVIKKIGSDGLINVVEVPGDHIYTEVQNGMLLESTAHVNKTTDVINPYIVLVSSAIEHVHQFKSCMDLANSVYTKSKSSMIIIAKEFSKEIQNIVIVNNRNKRFDVILVEADGFSNNMLEIMDDMAMLLNSEILSTDNTSSFGLQNITINHLAKIKSALVTPQQTILYSDTFLNENTLSIKNDLLNSINELKRSGGDKIGEIRQLEKRLHKFSKSATISVGGITDTARKEKYDRIDDTVRAINSAVNNGVVAGGGLTLYTAGKILDDNSILRAICNSPVKVLNETAKIENIYSILDSGKAVNFNTKEFGDPFKLGVLDPVDVQIKALEQAVVITKLLLNTNVIIVEVNEV